MPHFPKQSDGSYVGTEMGIAEVVKEVLEAFTEELFTGGENNGQS
jgi:hypothetical protein